MNIALFCGAKLGDDSSQSMAREFAAWMVQQGHTLVYVGGSTGLMGLVSKEMISSGAQVIGVIPNFLYEWEVGNDACSELIKVNTMHERKTTMCDLADAFIVLPGGFGTLDEVCEIVTWNQLKLISKPVGFLNGNGFFDLFFAFLNQAGDRGFISSSDLTFPQNLKAMSEFKFK